MAAAVLAAVAVACEQESVSDLSAELARHMHEAHEPDDQRAGHIAALGMENPALIDFEDFGFLVDDQAQRATDGENRQRFKRCVQSQTSHSRKAILLSP